MASEYPDYVKPDFSVRINTEDGGELVSRVYDHVHIFPFLGHSILKLLTTKGLMQYHISERDGHSIAEAAGITPIIRAEISEQEYLAYLQSQENMLDDSWLESEADEPPNRTDD